MSDDEAIPVEEEPAEVAVADQGGGDVVVVDGVNVAEFNLDSIHSRSMRTSGYAHNVDGVWIEIFVQPRCHTCTIDKLLGHPLGTLSTRTWIDTRLLYNWKQAVILRELPEEAQKFIGRSSLSTHAKEHIPAVASLARNSMEQHAASMALPINASSHSIANHQSLLSAMIETGGVELTLGKMEIKAPTLLRAIEVKHKIVSDTEATRKRDEDIFNLFMALMDCAIAHYETPEQERAFRQDVANMPMLAELARQDPDMIDVQEVLRELETNGSSA